MPGFITGGLTGTGSVIGGALNSISSQINNIITFKPRLTAPDYDDANWIQVAYGGKNQCIQVMGHSVLPNCTGYAWGRFMEILGDTPKLSRANAGLWYGNTSDGYERGQTPKLGAVACWSYPGEAGHVAIVERINSDGSITLSESGYPNGYFNESAPANTHSKYFWTSTQYPPNYYGGRYQFQGFIYNPATAGLRDKLSDFLDEAESHVGESGDWTWSKSGLSRGSAWCAAFIMAVGLEVGGIIREIIPFSYGAGDIPRFGVRDGMGAWIKGPYWGVNATPQPGDCILFRWNRYPNAPDEYFSDHIGIVLSVDSTHVTTIEGNNGSGNSYQTHVRQVPYSLSYTGINGYYRPNWPAIGASAGNLLMGSPLYDVMNTREDATLREIGYINSSYQPSIQLSNIKLSVVNYTTTLGVLFQNTTSTGSTANLDNLDTVPREIVEYFINKGLNTAAAIGIIANIKAESGFRTDIIEYGYTLATGGGAGLCQWTNYPRTSPTGRRTNMINRAGPNWRNNLTGQLNYLWYELNNGYVYTLNQLKQVPNTEAGARQAADIFVRNFEVPANVDDTSRVRQNYASEYWNSIAIQLVTDAVNTVFGG